MRKEQSVIQKESWEDDVVKRIEAESIESLKQTIDDKDKNNKDVLDVFFRFA